MTLPTTYTPSELEQKWYTTWEDKGYFRPTLDKPKSFSIAIPPPNVTGSLHMGHGFNNTIMDALTRFHRMKGYNTLWQPGTDHAGIATQMVVERQLGLDGISRHDLGREKFIEKVWEWKGQSGGNITRQIRRLGSSVDWSRERFTMDDDLSKVVKEVFVRLHDEGLIYRGKRLVNWDCKLHTALSDLEVESVEEQGNLWHFRYYFADKNLTTQDGKNYLVVATTRPETLLGDSAVAVHPEDERYAHLIGKTIVLPITGREVPIVADDYVEKDFGTGCVKITPAHDFNDYELGKRHNLPLINIFDENAHVKAEFDFIAKAGEQISDHITAPSEYAGLDRFVARKKLVEQAQNENWLEKIEPYTLKAPRGDRSGVIVEPLLTDQWYVKIAPLAEPAIQAVQNGDIKFVPEQYTNMYMAWMRDIQDWCISRQLWWGHRIPAWYDDNGGVYVGRDEDEVRAKYGLGDTPLRQDEDVLDTWFSSALWTFSTLDWTGTDADFDNAILQNFHPTSVLVTGFDIIFFWVARMIMMTLHFVKDKDGKPQVPFHTVYVHGLVRDSEGQKMSKSKGNVLDPLDLIDSIDLESLVAKRTTGLMNPKDAVKIEKATRKEFPEGILAYGTDAVRFTFASLASTGRDINFDLKRVEGYRNFCNKIWNATRFVLMNVEGKPISDTPRPELWELSEKWIISRLQKCEQAVNLAFETYRFDLASQAIYDFIWNEYCDWYVELVKPILNDESVPDERKAEIRRVLLSVLEVALRLTHPIMPFITEEIWQTLAPMLGQTGESIMLAPFPVPNDERIDEQAESDMAWLQSLIGAVRNIRGEMKLGNAVRLPVLLQGVTDEERASLARIESQFKALAKVETLTIVGDDDEIPLSSQALIGSLKVLVPMKGLIDPTAELNRLNKVREKLQAQADAISKKLSNEGFVAKAPAQVVEAEKAKLAELNGQIGEIEKQVGQLSSL
ncbi:MULTISPECIES: valine--tRNA ligase [Moraxella]|uniref:Valine--tRNA ligase n=1 Tax=Moraxella lacunata TaxID=477 RepID=A0A1B8Q2M5_MORLA|nr:MULTISPECIES: valine--tRNA ligase [Moraxella]MBE9577964.1 valine--tRNA ligase [Moraxella sp. K1664]MBE9587467.1 valine--tRNA ligase [Moraxella sp. K1630]MBE9595627.1 valine--tRNA ligase [Moraxella sp. K2450]MDH9218442.1 valine--tRNA ligase [Moraxella lacunata]MDI4481968.1 valine--tRNA ligase [Moraxella lacunata]